MARKPRIEYAGAVYHVINRGDQGIAYSGISWICERLKMGAAGNVGHYIREVRHNRDASVADLRKRLSVC